MTGWSLFCLMQMRFSKCNPPNDWVCNYIWTNTHIGRCLRHSIRSSMHKRDDWRSCAISSTHRLLLISSPLHLCASLGLIQVRNKPSTKCFGQRMWLWCMGLQEQVRLRLLWRPSMKHCVEKRKCWSVHKAIWLWIGLVKSWPIEACQSCV